MKSFAHLVAVLAFAVAGAVAAPPHPGPHVPPPPPQMPPSPFNMPPPPFNMPPPPFGMPPPPFNLAPPPIGTQQMPPLSLPEMPPFGMPQMPPFGMPPTPLGGMPQLPPWMLQFMLAQMMNANQPGDMTLPPVVPQDPTPVDPAPATKNFSFSMTPQQLQNQQNTYTYWTLGGPTPTVDPFTWFMQVLNGQVAPSG